MQPRSKLYGYGRLKNLESFPQQHFGNGHASLRDFGESDTNHQLLKFVRNGELEEGFKILEGMVYDGEIPDIIACTSLIHGFCKKASNGSFESTIAEKKGI